MEKDGPVKQPVSHQQGHARPLAKQGGWDNKAVLGILYRVFVLGQSKLDNVQRQGNLFLCSSQANALF